MRKKVKRILPILLAVILVFGMWPAVVQADTTEATAIELNHTARTLYIRNNVGEAFDLTATVQPSDYTGKVHWNYPRPNNVIGMTESDNRTVRLEALQPGVVDVTATVDVTGGGESTPVICKVTVVRDEIDGYHVEKNEYILSPGGTSKVNLMARYQSGYEEPAAGASFTVDDTSVATVDHDGLLSALKDGETNVNLFLDGQPFATVPVRVMSVQSLRVDPPALSLSVGETAMLRTEVLPSELTDYSLTWTDFDPEIISFDPNTRTVTARKAGETTITATVVGAANVSARCTVTVSNPTADFEDEVITGQALSLHKLYEALSARFNQLGGNSRFAVIRFPSVGNPDYGALYRSIAMQEEIENGYGETSDQAFSTLDSMHFVPGREGDYVIHYTLSDSLLTLSGVLTIHVGMHTADIRFHIYEGSDYTFADTSISGVSASGLFSSTLGSYGSIRFGNVVSGENVGTLYMDYNQNIGNRIGNGMTVNAEQVPGLYFAPSRSGTYQIGYVAYSGSDGSGNTLAGGTMTIVVGADALDLTLYLDSTDTYRFDTETRRSANSASKMLQTALDDSVGVTNWAFVRFGTPSETSAQVGTLFRTADTVLPLAAETYVERGGLNNVCFVPRQVGVYSTVFHAYSAEAENTLVASGTLTLIIPSIPYGSMDVYYRVAPGGTVSLSEDDFLRWFREVRGVSDTLAYVVFDEYQNDYGRFSYEGSEFAPFHSANYYTTAGAASANVRLLNRVVFTAPTESGFRLVRFTGYDTRGGTEQGTLLIYAPAGTIPSVSYDVSNQAPHALDDDGFVSAYQSATNSLPAPGQFIRLLDVPRYGTLYYGYIDASRPGVMLTRSNLGNYNFDMTGGATRLSNVTYVPSLNAGAVDTVPYVVCSASGQELYHGVITFRYTSEQNFYITTSGRRFETEDLYDGNGPDAVLYVNFRQPETGKLYVNYEHGRGTLITPETRLYTVSPADGEYPVSSLCFIPRAGSNARVKLEYTAHTRSGVAYEDAIIMNISTKDRSQIFIDVTPENVGTWAADSIDFAAMWGLVVGTDLEGPTYSPRNTMRRCDMVLILYRMAGSPAVNGAMPYPDVPYGAYYYNSALWASQHNIMAGVLPGGLYDPQGQITRQDFARILYNYTAAMGESVAQRASLNGYVDVNQVSDYALEAMAWAVANGYITSTSLSELVLSPRLDATRAEIATLLHRYLTY